MRLVRDDLLIEVEAVAVIASFQPTTATAWAFWEAMMVADSGHSRYRGPALVTVDFAVHVELVPCRQRHPASA